MLETALELYHVSDSNDTIYRVVSMPLTTRKVMKQVREKRGLTNAALLAEAVNQHLDELVSEMNKLGLSREKGPRSLVRLPLSKKEKTLDKLRSASLLVQIPVTVLMTACIKAAISNPPATGKRTRKHKATS